MAEDKNYLQYLLRREMQAEVSLILVSLGCLRSLVVWPTPSRNLMISKSNHPRKKRPKMKGHSKKSSEISERRLSRPYKKLKHNSHQENLSMIEGLDYKLKGTF